MRPFLVITGFLVFACWLGLIDYYEAHEDFSDTGVGCVDDCLEPMEPEPLPVMEA